jgi:hypothetical protein
MFFIFNVPNYYTPTTQLAEQRFESPSDFLTFTIEPRLNDVSRAGTAECGYIIGKIGY